MHFKWEVLHIMNCTIFGTKTIVLLSSSVFNSESDASQKWLLYQSMWKQGLGAGKDGRCPTNARWGSGPHAMTKDFEGRMLTGILAGFGLDREEVDGGGW